MRIKARDVGLLAVGFYIGATVAVVFTTELAQPLNLAPASSVVINGPVLATASLPPPFTTNIQWQTPPVDFVPPPQFIDMSVNLDLIDTRYEPEIKLDGFK